MAKDIIKLVEEQRAYYKSIVSVYSPILEGTVYFTSIGFNHLLYEANRRPRKLSERYMKLKCLNHATTVLVKCDAISKTRQVEVKIKGKTKKVIWHELVCEIQQGVIIRVIVEKVGTGKLKFKSIMPHKNSSKPKKRPNGRSLAC